MSKNQNQRTQKKGVPEKPLTLWGRFIALTLGNTVSFLSWMLMAINVSILIEWIGMLFWWEADHAQSMLQSEIDYLSQFSRNSLLTVHPSVMAQAFIETINSAYAWLRLPEFLPWLQQHVFILYVAISSAIDVTYMMCIRLVTIVFTLPVFLLWFVVAAIDGLSERDIRKYEGGLESSFIYHKVKPFIFPAIALSCGLYLTLPFSMNPALFFLVPQFILFTATFWTCATFKKFL